MQVATTVQTDDRFVFGARHWLAVRGIQYESIPMDVPGCGPGSGMRHWRLVFVNAEDAIAFRTLFSGIVIVG